MTSLKKIESKRILVLGNTGFLGRALFESLKGKGYLVIGTSKSQGTDIRKRGSLDGLIQKNKINTVFNCAATVGGIEFGRLNPVTIFNDNIEMTISILESAARHDVKVINPISNCAYPSNLSEFKEEDFWNGPLDESVLVYGMARKYSVVGTWAYRQEKNLDSVNLVFPNLYGPGDHKDPVRAHALGALVFRFLRAKLRGDSTVSVWGSGNPIREWMFILDAVTALELSMFIENQSEIVNIGTGQGVSIRQLALMISKEVGYEGATTFDATMPDGAPCKTMNGSQGQKLLGWSPSTSLKEGIARTVRWYEREM